MSVGLVDRTTHTINKTSVCGVVLCRVCLIVTCDAHVWQQVVVKAVEAPHTQEGATTVDTVFVQQSTDYLEKCRIPQVQFLDKVDDTPRCHAAIQLIQTTAPIPQVQFLDNTVDIHVVVKRQVTMVQPLPKNVDVPELQFIDKVVDILVVAQTQIPQCPNGSANDGNFAGIVHWQGDHAGCACVTRARLGRDHRDTPQLHIAEKVVQLPVPLELDHVVQETAGSHVKWRTSWLPHRDRFP